MESIPRKFMRLPLEKVSKVLEVIRWLRAGRIESDIMPLNESLSVMSTVDQIREPCADRNFQT